jgi:hypothetical protein
MSYNSLVNFNDQKTYSQYKILINLNNFIYKKRDYLYKLQNITFVGNDILYILACKILPQYYLKIINDKITIISTFLHYCNDKTVNKKIFTDKFTVICNNIFYIRNKVIHYKLNEKIMNDISTLLCKNIKKFSKIINNTFISFIDITDINVLISKLYYKMVNLMLVNKEYSKSKAEVIYKLQSQKLLSPLPHGKKITFHGTVEEYYKQNIKAYNKYIFIRLINTDYNRTQEFKKCKSIIVDNTNYGPRFYYLKFINGNNSYIYMLNGNYHREIKNRNTTIEVID